MSHFEIEIKSLLGDSAKATDFKTKILAKGAKLTGQNKQLNHYFVYTDLALFQEKLLPYIPTEKQELFSKITTEGKNFSIRTRQADQKVLLVIKASLDDHSSANGVSRMEFEVPVALSLTELDQLLLDSGLTYQAKWSREREEYELGDTAICLDKNAGYGYLAEFEKVIDDQTKAVETKASLAALMAEVGVVELAQDRLERMFDFYNKNWADYYGTDKTFNIE